MERYLNDPKWRSSQRKCCFLSLIPVLGYFGLIFMGKKSGRQQYRRLGIGYGVLSVGCFLAYVLSVLCDRIRWDSTIASILYRLEENLRLIGSLGILLLWLVCMIHTFVSSGEYLKFAALHALGAPRRSPLTANDQWRTQNSGWMIWAYLPSLSGLALIFAGRQLKKRGLTAFGIFAMVISWSFSIAEPITYRLCSYAISTALGAVGTWLTILLWIGLTIYVFLIREDYLDARAMDWTATTSRYNVLLDRKWRNSNSIWQVWTTVPYLGGIGVFIGGVRSRKKSHMLLGSVIIVLSLGYMLANILLNQALYDSHVIFTDAADIYRAFIDALWPIGILGYSLTIFAGCFIRWESLVSRAASLQGYSNEFERELDLYNRRQARSVPAPVAPVAPVAPKTQKTPKKPKAEPAAKPIDIPATPVASAAKAETSIDINSCTTEELMTLPGIGIVQAKQAMEYRTQHGGFRSVDEFIDVLMIKPHFAVQILSRASANAAPQPVHPVDSGAARRRIDF